MAATDGLTTITTPHGFRIRLATTGCLSVETDVSASTTEVGIRKMRNNLSGFDRVSAGEALIVTDRGRPVAKLWPIESAADRLRDSSTPEHPPPALQQRHRPPSRISAEGSVSELVAQQRCPRQP